MLNFTAAFGRRQQPPTASHALNPPEDGAQRKARLAGCVSRCSRVFNKCNLHPIIDSPNMAGFDSIPSHPRLPSFRPSSVSVPVTKPNPLIKNHALRYLHKVASHFPHQCPRQPLTQTPHRRLGLILQHNRAHVPWSSAPPPLCALL